MPVHETITSIPWVCAFGLVGIYSRFTCKDARPKLRNGLLQYNTEGVLMENNHCPYVGIDVASKFSYYGFITPDGKDYCEPIKANNDARGLAFILKKLKDVEKTLGRPTLVIESTGHYSSRLVYFFTRNDFKIILVNPLQSHAIKACSIRKVKTDRMDCRELARMPLMTELRVFEPRDDYTANLRVLTRTLSRLTEQRVDILNQLCATLEQIWPGYDSVFTQVNSKASLEILTKHSSPDSFLAAKQEDIVQLIRAYTRRSQDYAANKYQQLRQAAIDAKTIGVQLTGYALSVQIYSSQIQALNIQMNQLHSSIDELSEKIPAVALLKTIPGIGDTLAPLIAAEIGDITRFGRAKQLVAYCGVDPSVRQSGNFVASQTRFTKRGSPYIRRALYIAATVAIRKDAGGNYVNQVIYDYYQNKITTKAKKQALGAIMNKLVKIIYSVLKNQHPFVLITPQEQKEIYLHGDKLVA